MQRMQTCKEQRGTYAGTMVAMVMNQRTLGKTQTAPQENGQKAVISIYVLNAVCHISTPHQSYIYIYSKKRNRWGSQHSEPGHTLPWIGSRKGYKKYVKLFDHERITASLTLHGTMTHNCPWSCATQYLFSTQGRGTAYSQQSSIGCWWTPMKSMAPNYPFTLIKTVKTEHHLFDSYSWI